MSMQLIFWILMLVWLVFGWFGPQLNARWAPMGSTLLLFILLLILGWQVFGAPVHG
jgi:hypothetical protein